MRPVWFAGRAPRLSGRLGGNYLDRVIGLNGGYVATGIHHDRLKVSVPFVVDIDLPALAEKKARLTAD